MSLVDSFTTPKHLLSAQNFTTLKDLEQKGSILGAKILLDYSYALQYLYNTSSSPYLAIFEDDIIFANGWLARTVLALQDIERRTKATGKDWLDLRLFNNESNIGFASHDFLGNNVPFIILGAITAICLILRLSLPKISDGRRAIITKVCFVLCCFTLPLFIISFFQAGKSSVLPPSAGIARQQWGLCTQVVIIPRKEVPGLIMELRRAEYKQPDIVMKYWADKKGLQRYVLNPVQVQHLGEDTFQLLSLMSAGQC